MLNYAKGQPIGDNNAVIFDAPPAVKAVIARMSENANTSSVVTLGHNTTAIEVVTGGTLALIRWVYTGDTEASVFGNASVMNYDNAIPANWRQRYVVPIETNPASGYSSFQGRNRELGLFQRIAWRTAGIASVYMTEYGSMNSVIG